MGNNNATVEVPSTAGLSVGDSVLIIQMKGAEIYDNNNAGYGDVTNYNGAGAFEYAIICDIQNNEVSFNADFLNTYDEAGAIQLISIPKFNNVSIDNTLTGQAWDGTTGGVIILEATSSITLNANIDANGIGYRGGISDSSIFDCAWFDNFPNFTYDITTGYGAMKGEGIAYYGSETAGKGALANGGGGGNDHNSGGGGGSNISGGGKGGQNNEPNPNNCVGNHPGVGGKPLSNFGSYAFMGGGGGAGHANNLMITDGGTGGGIVILMANTIIGNGQTISSNGTNAVTSFEDGAGGGGAGGSILLYANSISSTLNLSANGGNGGNTGGTSADRCFGPGGGGSGGVIWFKNSSTPVGVNININGGENGLVTSPSTSCSGLSNGAVSGQNGVTQYNLQVKTNAIYAEIPDLDLGDDAAICQGDELILTSPEGTRYLWSNNTTDQSTTITAPGYYSLILFTGGCIDYDTIFVNLNENPVNILPGDTILCSYLGVDLDAGDDGISYEWSTGSTSQVINVNDEEVFVVTITNAEGCTTIGEVEVNACSNNLEIPNLITPNGDGHNDNWIIETIYSYPGNSVEIYNRNGALLFSQTNYDNSWNGDGLPATTYYYVIEFNNGGNKQYGSISIVREK